MEKIPLTPGKLYARLSEEFHRRRTPECASCHMPMVYVIEREMGYGANWMVDEVAMGCEECRDVVNEIVHEYACRYDIFDPTCTPVPTARNLASRPFTHPPRST